MYQPEQDERLDIRMDRDDDIRDLRIDFRGKTQRDLHVLQP